MKKNDWNEDFGMKVIEERIMINVDNISVNKEYQRCIENKRLKKIYDSISNFGYWPSEVITLNEKHEAIDGNHRVNACRKIGIKKVPCSIVTFPDKKTEIRYFSHKNNWNTGLRPVDNWHARFYAGHPVASLIYRLESDKDSNFYNRIAIKGKKSNKQKFNVNDALVMLNTSVFRDTSQWNVARDTIMSEKTKTTSYNIVLKNSNYMLDIFYGSFGKLKQENPIAYRTDSIKAFCRFYQKLYLKGILNSDYNKKTIINKMKTLDLNVAFLKADQTGKVLFFITHYNNGKSDKNRIAL